MKGKLDKEKTPRKDRTEKMIKSTRTLCVYRPELPNSTSDPVKLQRTTNGPGP
jgi:hypothetical protein